MGKREPSAEKRHDPVHVFKKGAGQRSQMRHGAWLAVSRWADACSV